MDNNKKEKDLLTCAHFAVPQYFSQQSCIFKLNHIGPAVLKKKRERLFPLPSLFLRRFQQGLQLYFPLHRKFGLTFPSKH